MMDRRLEERYVVIKLNKLTAAGAVALSKVLHDYEIDTVGCVVVEEDWPEYGPTVDAIMERVNVREAD